MAHGPFDGDSFSFLLDFRHGYQENRLQCRFQMVTGLDKPLRQDVEGPRRPSLSANMANGC